MGGGAEHVTLSRSGDGEQLGEQRGQGGSEQESRETKGKRENPLQREEFVSFVRKGLVGWKVPGISVAFVDCRSVKEGDDDGSVREDGDRMKEGEGEEEREYDIWTEGFGYATLPRSRVARDEDGFRGKDDGILAAGDTLYYAGSTTKAFTSAVLGMMIHPLSQTEDGGNKGRQPLSKGWSPSMPASSRAGQERPAPGRPGGNSVDPPEAYTTKFPHGFRTPISAVIRDDFVLSDEWATRHVTFEDALSHRTGLARHDKALAQFYPDSDVDGTDKDEGKVKKHRGDARDFTRLLRHLPLVAEPRISLRYCNLMFLAVARAIEVATGGKWLGELMREWIWTPLGMKGTFLSLQDAERDGKGKLAAGYWWDYLEGEGEKGQEDKSKARGEEEEEEKGRFHFIQPMDLSGGSGAGGVVSSVSDYALWIRCLLEQAPPLSQACHKEMKTPRMVSGGEGKQDGYDGPLSYALGWFAGTYRGHRVYQHGGGMEAYGTCLYFFPDLKFGVVTMGNTAITSNCLGDCVAWRLIDDRLGVPEEERFDWAGKWNEAVNKVLKKPDTAIEEYFPHRAKPPLSRSLPLDAYAGTYYNPAYQNLMIQQSNDKTSAQSRAMRKGDDSGARELYAAHHDRVWQMDFEFEHVSGEHWLIYIDFKNMPNRLMHQYSKAQFRIGFDGKVEGVDIEHMEGGSEGVIKYTKIE